MRRRETVKERKKRDRTDIRCSLYDILLFNITRFASGGVLNVE